MATSQQNRVIEHLRRSVLVRDGAGLSDGQLLECFIAGREEAAFEAIVRRHGPMVLNVCRRVLRNSHDAEDAFQATFLVLARKASSIRSRELVSNWLYGVAYQTARKATVVAAKRQARERLMNDMPEPAAAANDSSLDWQALLDQELSSLPDKYRSPMVLCDLEGKSRREAAQQLGLAEGTLSSRLARARAMLAKRLLRHGLALSGGALATLISQNASAAVPAPLLGAAVKTASTTAAISVRVAALADGVIKAMFLARLKTTLAMLVLAGITLLGGGLSFQALAVPCMGEASASRKNAEARIPAENDLARMQGAWVLVRPSGPAAPPCFGGPADGPLQLFIAGNRLATVEGSEGMSFTLDATHEPRAIDLTTADGKVVHGIYRVDRDEVRLCFGVGDQPGRPASFAAAENRADVVQWTFKRRSETLEHPSQPEPASPPASPDPPERDLAGPRKSCFACHGHNTAFGPHSVRGDRVKIQGSWQLVAIRQGNTVVSNEDGAKKVVIFNGGKVSAGGSDFRSFALKPGHKLDLTNAAGQVYHGLYQFDGNELKICFPLEEGRPRPSSFAAAEGDPATATWLLRRR